MRKSFASLGALGATVALSAATAVPAGADRGAYNNWHVHDGGSGTDETGLVHRGLALFPAIMTGGDVAAYLADPAYCPDATDKFLLPNGANGAFPAAGVCMNSAYIIHIRAIPAGHAAPAGWHASGFPIEGAEVYYQLTPR